MMINKEQLTAKRNENELVLKEFDLLDADSNVYKLVGPILAKQDLNESKGNVKERIKFLDGEM